MNCLVRICLNWIRYYKDNYLIASLMLIIYEHSYVKTKKINTLHSVHKIRVFLYWALWVLFRQLTDRKPIQPKCTCYSSIPDENLLFSFQVYEGIIQIIFFRSHAWNRIPFRHIYFSKKSIGFKMLVYPGQVEFIR